MAATHPGPGSGGGAGSMSGGGFDASGVVGGLSATEAKMLADRVSTMQREHDAALSKIRAEASRAQVSGDGGVMLSLGDRLPCIICIPVNTGALTSE